MSDRKDDSPSGGTAVPPRQQWHGTSAFASIVLLSSRGFLGDLCLALDQLLDQRCHAHFLLGGEF
jgi:hypothetical protein